MPVLLNRAEVRSLLGHTKGKPPLVGTLLYGAGLRLPEAPQLRIKDVNLDARVLTIRVVAMGLPGDVHLPAQ